jgi:betaine-aldehyde dehydrogenase
MQKYPDRPFINGKFQAPGGSARLPQINPATEEVLCEVAAAGLPSLNAAIDGAQQAYVDVWRDLAPGKRTEILFNVARLVRDNLEQMAQMESRNIGKPIADARDEIGLGARVFEYYAGAVTKIFGQTIPVARWF